jgi:hypothetical protein
MDDFFSKLIWSPCCSATYVPSGILIGQAATKNTKIIW